MRVFKNKWFMRFAKKFGIQDKTLCDVIERIEGGLIDADLGGCIIKQRISREGQGRSGGYRTLIAYRSQKRSFFIYGFAKNQRDNIKDEELETFKELGKVWLEASEQRIKKSLEEGLLKEVYYEKKI